MTVTDDLLANNARYAETFDKGDLPLRPGFGLAGGGVYGRPLRPAQAAGDQ